MKKRNPTKRGYVPPNWAVKDGKTPLHQPMVSPPKDARRLRSPTPQEPLHVVLVEPEIPPNTGNIARLCAATSSRLHLVHPLGFSVDEKAVRRAGLDYWHLVDKQEHASLEAALEVPFRRRFFFSGTAAQSYLDVCWQPGDALFFGRESVGLPLDLLDRFPAQTVGIPMPGRVRSLNLANAVAIGLYEALRQIGALQEATLSE